MQSEIQWHGHIPIGDGYEVRISQWEPRYFASLEEPNGGCAMIWGAAFDSQGVEVEKTRVPGVMTLAEFNDPTRKAQLEFEIVHNMVQLIQDILEGLFDDVNPINEEEV